MFSGSAMSCTCTQSSSSQDPENRLGKLLCQGLLQVSEPKFFKAGKERQVFAFQTVLVFARKVDLGQAKFKYEFKFELPVSELVPSFCC